jgi:hypothetical protein
MIDVAIGVFLQIKFVTDRRICGSIRRCISNESSCNIINKTVITSFIDIIFVKNEFVLYILDN